ncbi:MFS transporter [Mycolicibacterium mengxianglii]|uniref:MFS transporter n=1 Tax=Mycolicibacterium mengxianglii TaxID=2736649 RepID=UPI0018D14D42|nr:MFS transporter [Mycolicibacterium mengxianglii]
MTVTARTGTAPRPHWAWVVAAVSFVAILGAAGFRSVPGVMMNPLHDEFGWSHGVVGLAMAVNMTLFGLTAPFAAALMDRFGIRPVLTGALGMIAAGSALSVTMTASWQLVLFWGVLVGAGTGAISMGFVATIATRWFEAQRGLVTGVLTAAGATGQLIFLPAVAAVTTQHGWRWASLLVATGALVVIPPVVLLMRNWPHDKGLTPYGREPAVDTGPAPRPPGSSFAAAFSGLLVGARVPAFWLLAGSFAICGMTTNGLIGTHFIPAANDHGMPTTVAAGLLALIGVMDVAGTVFSGWLTDRVDPRLLLVVYYTGRGISLTLLPALLSPHADPGTWVFIIFYGLDWVATVPPTIALCRNYFGSQTPIVFGWVFAAHQLGAAVAAAGAGWLRDLRGDYDLAFYLAAGLCAAAALLCLSVRRAAPIPAPEPAR